MTPVDRELRSDAVGVVLAGGRSSRFGSPKAFAVLDGETLVERAVRTHRSVFAKVVIAGPDALLYRRLGLTAIQDSIPGRGALAGIETTLRWADANGASGIVCSPCDSPFVTPRLLSALVEGAEGHEAVVPRAGRGDKMQPQIAWYSVACAAAARACLLSGRLALRDFVATLRSVSFLSPEVVAASGDPERMFVNINTPADLDHARHLIGSG